MKHLRLELFNIINVFATIKSIMKPSNKLNSFFENIILYVQVRLFIKYLLKMGNSWLIYLIFDAHHFTKDIKLRHIKTFGKSFDKMLFHVVVPLKFHMHVTKKNITNYDVLNMLSTFKATNILYEIYFDSIKVYEMFTRSINYTINTIRLNPDKVKQILAIINGDNMDKIKVYPNIINVWNPEINKIVLDNLVNFECINITNSTCATLSNYCDKNKTIVVNKCNHLVEINTKSTNNIIITKMNVENLILKCPKINNVELNNCQGFPLKLVSSNNRYNNIFVNIHRLEITNCVLPKVVDIGKLVINKLIINSSSSFYIIKNIDILYIKCPIGSIKSNISVELDKCNDVIINSGNSNVTVKGDFIYNLIIRDSNISNDDLFFNFVSAINVKNSKKINRNIINGNYIRYINC